MATPPNPPPSVSPSSHIREASMLRQNPLLKQRSWSPESDYEESWQRRKSLYRDRRARRSVSVTDEDIEELRGFLDLGLVFGDGPPDCSDGAKRLSEALPALDLYFAVRQAYNKSTAGGNSMGSASPSSSDASLAESPLSVFSISQSDSPKERQAGIRRWARLVALAARDS